MSFLAGLRVLDMAEGGGGFGGRLLADLGADVLKLEPPGGEAGRRTGPFADGAAAPDNSIPFWFDNAGKRGLVVDLASAAGRARFRALAAQADVLIETTAPGQLEALGLGYGALSELNPGLIQVAITPFGQTGPRRDWRATDLTAWATGGAMRLCGEPERPPLWAPGQAWHLAGMWAAVGVLAALREQRARGCGQFIDVSLQEAVASTSDTVPLAWLHQRAAVLRRGSEHPLVVPCKVVPCQDGHAMIVAINQGQWRALTEWLADDGLLGEFGADQWLDMPTRLTARAAIHALVARWAALYDRATLFHRGQALGIPLGQVNRPGDVARDPQLAARQFFLPVAHPELGRTIRYPGRLIRGGDEAPAERRRAPLLVEAARAGGMWEPRPPRPPAPLAGAGEHGTPLARRDGSGAGGGGSAKPLAGVKIADFTWAVAGPYGARILADLGADVIKVERIEVGCPNRNLPPFTDGQRGPNRSGFFNTNNRGKRSLTLNLQHPEGIALARRLVGWADVVLENFSGGTMERLGLGYDRLAAEHPELIMVRLSGYGQTGPYRDYSSYAPTLYALSGLTHAIAYRADEPLGVGTALGDFAGGLMAAIATLAALAERERSGRGQQVDVSQFEICASLIGPQLLAWLANERGVEPHGNRDGEGGAAPHGVYPCAGTDRWLALAVTSDDDWAALRRVMGDPAWAQGPRWATAAGRRADQDLLDRQIAAWTRTQDAVEATTRLQAAGLAAGVVQDGRDLVENDPQLAARAFFQPVVHPEVGEMRVDRLPPLMSLTPPRVQGPAPLLGQHTEAILRDLLGLDQETIDRYLVEGVV